MGLFTKTKPPQAPPDGPATSERFNSLFANVPADGDRGSMTETVSNPLDKAAASISSMPCQGSYNEELIKLDKRRGIEHALPGGGRSAPRPVEEAPRQPRTLKASNSSKFTDLYGTVSADGHSAGMTSYSHTLDRVSDNISAMPGPESLNQDLIKMDKKTVMSKDASTGVTVVEVDGEAVGKQMEDEMKKKRFNSLFGGVSADGHSGHRMDADHSSASADISSLPIQGSYNEDLVKMDSKRGPAHAFPAPYVDPYGPYPVLQPRDITSSANTPAFASLFGTVSADGNTAGMTEYSDVLDRVAADMGAMPEFTKTPASAPPPAPVQAPTPEAPRQPRTLKASNSRKFTDLYGTVSADGHSAGMTVYSHTLDRVSDNISAMPGPESLNRELMQYDSKKVMGKDASTGVTVAPVATNEIGADDDRKKRFNSLFGDVPVDGSASATC